MKPFHVALTFFVKRYADVNIKNCRLILLSILHIYLEWVI